MTKNKQNLIECEKEDSNNKYRSYLQFSSPAIFLRPVWGTVYKKKNWRAEDVISRYGFALWCAFRWVWMSGCLSLVFVYNTRRRRKKRLQNRGGCCSKEWGKSSFFMICLNRLLPELWGCLVANDIGVVEIVIVVVINGIGFTDLGPREEKQWQQ